ncbi:MAG: DUF3368 domain-containing protein [Thiofilum sp.]|uniref:DUF3368 domain-containing protein n=1 Tax=Thiofilum sp. TaxID=2212733 RepID=UPI0025D4FBE8|nr:DUF3368 domain-containing protein [Thiofilum sp.]MBK8454036.1 DUF3368 domain-containing protein [Thiofilum sp.]
MSIVFCNTTPFIALSSINRLSLMQQCFNEVYVVEEVIAECGVGGRITVPDLYSLEWVKPVKSLPLLYSTILLELDLGERHTIDMAKRYAADWLIIDEKAGRNLAEYLGLKVVGTLGILLKSKQQGWLDSFTSAANQMVQQGIRYHPELIRRLARQVGE